VLEAHSAGSPTDEAVRWTDLVLVQQVLAGAGYRRRSLRKALSTGDVEPHERDWQFRLIATLRRQARARGVPVLCVDTRKKERLGHLPRRGSCYSTDVQFVYDRDYRHLATGVLVPHGVYDYHGNAGFITKGADGFHFHSDFPFALFAGDLPPVGKDLIRHQLTSHPRKVNFAPRVPSAISRAPPRS